MQFEIIDIPKQKTWGYIPLPEKTGHFYTGYEGYSYSTRDFIPKHNMKMSKNVIITGNFKFNSMYRGRSAANFEGYFQGHESVIYDFSMSGMLELLSLIQNETFKIENGYIAGKWTFAKQGQQIFLKAYV